MNLPNHHPREVRLALRNEDLPAHLQPHAARCALRAFAARAGVPVWTVLAFITCPADLEPHLRTRIEYARSVADSGIFRPHSRLYFT